MKKTMMDVSFKKMHERVVMVLKQRGYKTTQFKKNLVEALVMCTRWNGDYWECKNCASNRPDLCEVKAGKVAELEWGECMTKMSLRAIFKYEITFTHRFDAYKITIRTDREKKKYPHIHAIEVEDTSTLTPQKFEEIAWFADWLHEKTGLLDPYFDLTILNRYGVKVKHFGAEELISSIMPAYMVNY